MIYTVYIWPLIFSGILLFLTGSYISRFKPRPAVKPLTAGLWSGAVWALLYALAVSSTSLQTRLLLGNLTITAIMAVIFSYYVAVLEYIGRRSILTRMRLLGTASVMLLITILAFTSPYHTLFRYNFSIELTHHYSAIKYTTGPLYLLYAGFIYLFSITSILLLLSTALSRRQDSANLVLFATAIVIPFMSSLLYFANLSPLPGFDISPIVQVFSAALFIAALASNRWLDITYIARDLVMDHLEDPVIVIDAQHNLVDFNPPAQKLLGISRRDIPKKPAPNIPAQLSDLLGKFTGRDARQEEVTLSSEGEDCSYQLTVTPILDGLQRRLGSLFVLHDITRLKYIQDVLVESEEKFRRLAETTAAGMFIFDGSHYVFVNPAFIKFTGYSAQELYSMDPMGLFHPAEREAIRQRASARLRGEDVPLRYELLCITRSGEERWMDLTNGLITFNGKPATLGTFFDITDRRRLELEVRTSRALYQDIVENQTDLVTRWTPEYRLTLVNKAYSDYFRKTREDLVGSYFIDERPPETREVIRNAVALLLNGEADHLTREELNIGPGGLYRWAVWTYQPIRDEHGRIIEIQSIGHDITDRKRSEEALQKVNRELAIQLDKNWMLQEKLLEQALRDPLTGLYNRRYLHETLDREIAGAKRSGYPVSAIMMDIDEFKNFNDTYGHLGGDLILRSVGQVLRTHTRQMDIVCRYGGEEFLIFMPTIPLESAVTRAELLRQAVDELALDFNGQNLHITISAGVAAYPENASNGDSLLLAADQAMYAAKNAGRNRVVVYSPKLSSE